MTEPTQLPPIANHGEWVQTDAFRVVVKGIDIPFWDMVWFMVKWSVAAIPAAIIIVFGWLFIYGFIAAALFHR